MNILEMKCLRSLVGVLRMDGVRNEEVRRRAGIERELESVKVAFRNRGKTAEAARKIGKSGEP